MCELLGMSARYETNLNESLKILRKRGGEIGPHSDGWGVSLYQDRELHLYKEPQPAADSKCLRIFCEADLRSQLILSHIRRANPSHLEPTYSNTHPFTRPLWNQTWVFAHNGKLSNRSSIEPNRFSAVGQTDSERSFCWLLDHLQSEASPSLVDSEPQNLLEILSPLVSSLNREGEFNFFLSNGKWLICHAHNRLHVLVRTCRENGCEQRVLLVASNPLTDEPWRCVMPNTLLITRKGRIEGEVKTEGKSPTPPGMDSISEGSRD